MDDKVQEFLKKIAAIESSSGKDLDHDVVESGIHAGDAAIGTYGLMPNTIDELVSRSKNKTPEMKALMEMNGEEKKEFLLKNPKVEQKLAEQLANHVLNKQGGDEEKAAYSWLYGHNLSSDKIKSRNYENDPYVQKFKELREPAMDENNNKMLIQPGSDEEKKLKEYIEGLDKKNAKKEALLKISKQQGEQLLGDYSGKFRDSGRTPDNFGENIDSIFGVPARTAISEAQKGNFNLEGLKKVLGSVGTDPRNAPTGFDIAEATGVENPYLGAALATAVDVGAQVPGLGAMGKSGGGIAGTVEKVSPQMEKFLKMRQALQREGGSMDRLVKGKDLSQLSHEANMIASGAKEAGTLQELQVKQKGINKMKGLK